MKRKTKTSVSEVGTGTISCCGTERSQGQAQGIGCNQFQRTGNAHRRAKGCASGPGPAWWKKRIPAAIAVLLALFLLRMSDATAAEWLVEPTASLYWRHDDNIGLEPGNGESTRATTLEAGAQVRRSTEVMALRARALLNYTDYDNLRDRDQQALDWAARYKGQRHVWAFNGVYKRDTSFAVITDQTLGGIGQTPSEVVVDGGEIIVVVPDPGGIGEPDLTDIGVTEEQIRRDRLTLRPSWDYDLTQRTSVGLSYRFIDVSYEDEPGVDLVDHRTHAVEGRLAYKLAPNETVIGTIEGAQFSADETDTETDNVSLVGTYVRGFSPLFEGLFALGVRRSSIDEPGGDDTSTGPIVRARLTRKLQAGRLSFSAGREVRPSGSRRMVESDHVDAVFERDLTPRLTFGLGGTAFKIRSLQDDGIDTAARQYYRIEPALYYALTREVNLEGSYRYRWQERDVDPGSAESNAVLIGIRYLGRL